VKKDLVSAFMWLTLSARAGDKAAARERDKLRGELPAAQRQEAEHRADQWKPKAKNAKG
jgi:hypothetical protein